VGAAVVVIQVQDNRRALQEMMGREASKG